MASSSRTKRIRYSGEQVAEIVADSGSDFDDLNEDSNSDEKYSLIDESEQESEADLDSNDFENIDYSTISNSNSDDTSNDDFSADVTQPNPTKNNTRGPMCGKKLEDSQKFKIFLGHLAQHNNAMLWM